ncbi:hypothetical protein [Curtobacterium sp. MCBA15_001]|uniref:hypothetical protein n=1 Tax=Curtobacterium sp. MCBA15_001 TaxID=1898731 RepID=UPI0008DD875D|nr:hypothetical protein [Curtobacterium sp. MCBA15_001]OIH92499.1 hypothetical protein BIU90_11545 [Curtobacterium sp. MCBA15_001]
MDIKHIITPLAVALVAGGAVTATAGAADAATPASTPSPSSSASHLPEGASLGTIQAHGEAATTKRISSLNAAITKVDADTTLTSSDKSTLLGTLKADVTGMDHLHAALAADTTVAQARIDDRTIVTQYRVYRVALPQERIVRAADRATAKALPRLQQAEQRLSDRLAKHTAKDSDAAKAALADLQKQISSLQSDTQGLAAAGLAVTPAQDDTNHDVLSATGAKAKAVRSEEQAAAKDAKAIRAALHG